MADLAEIRNKQKKKRENKVLKRPTAFRLNGIVGHRRVKSFYEMDHPLSHSRGIGKSVRTGLSGAEKRRKRKGGNPRGGPGQGGYAEQMRKHNKSIEDMTPGIGYRKAE